MKYTCSGCFHIYDEYIGNNKIFLNENINYFSDLKDDFFCPFCGTPKSDFILIQENINYPINKNNLTNIEKEHFPSYQILNDKLLFSIYHENDGNHFIYKVCLFDNCGELIDTKNFTFNQKITGSFDISYLDEFELRIFCSKNGIFSTGILSS